MQHDASEGAEEGGLSTTMCRKILLRTGSALQRFIQGRFSHQWTALSREGFAELFWMEKLRKSLLARGTVVWLELWSRFPDHWCLCLQKRRKVLPAQLNCKTPLMGKEGQWQEHTALGSSSVSDEEKM